MVSAEGEVDLHTAPQLDELLRSIEGSDVILDLTEAAFVDSTTLNILIAAAKRMQAEGGSLVIAAGNPTVARLFEITASIVLSTFTRRWRGRSRACSSTRWTRSRPTGKTARRW